MNLHPIFVHFPLTVLTLYAILEITSYFKCAYPDFARKLKAFLLVVGVVFGVASAAFGGVAEGLIKPEGDLLRLVEMHSLFAGLTLTVFGVLAVVHVVRLIDTTENPFRVKLESGAYAGVWNFLKSFARLFAPTWVLPVIAFVGLLIVLTTGALGGAIVYGPDFDPAITFVYKTLLGAATTTPQGVLPAY